MFLAGRGFVVRESLDNIVDISVSIYTDIDINARLPSLLFFSQCDSKTHFGAVKGGVDVDGVERGWRPLAETGQNVFPALLNAYPSATSFLNHHRESPQLALLDAR